jgi:hypothetical protein
MVRAFSCCRCCCCWNTTLLPRYRTIRRASSDFHAGDILVFSAYLMHAPLTNTTDRLRFSTDTRYQLASQPQDMRHMGPIPDEFNRQQGEGSGLDSRQYRVQFLLL